MRRPMTGTRQSSGMGTLLESLRGAVDELDGRVPPPPRPEHRTAAVLVLADRGDPSLPLLFVRRRDDLRHHPGQIGFPGGGMEPGDADLAATALREAAEEVGLPERSATVIGRLPSFVTAVSDNWLTPVVALLDEPFDVRGDGIEVAEWFWAPLERLMTAPHDVRELERDGIRRRVHFYDFDGHVIWGVTGAIVHELLGRLGRRD